MPEFIKYIGIQCLVTHLKAYYNKIVEVVNDEKLLIYFFQDNLSDTTLTWYMWLDNTKVKKWKDLVDAFIRKYKFNIYVDPDTSSLQAMEKDKKEFIKEYVQRWREAAAHVKPFIVKKEMINLFLNTFKTLYFKYLVRSSAQCFIELVIIVERIEQAIGLGKIVDPTVKKNFTGKIKETKVHNTKDDTKGMPKSK